MREILIRAGKVAIRARLLETPTAERIWAALPIHAQAQMWGHEVYFGAPVSSDCEPEAREVVQRRRDRLLAGRQRHRHRLRADARVEEGRDPHGEPVQHLGAGARRRELLEVGARGRGRDGRRGERARPQALTAAQACPRADDAAMQPNDMDAASMALKLYYHPLSSFCHKVLIALYENDTPFAGEIVDLGNKDAHARFFGLWPIGKMPLLHDESLDRTVPGSYDHYRVPGSALSRPMRVSARRGRSLSRSAPVGPVLRSLCAVSHAEDRHRSSAG